MSLSLGSGPLGRSPAGTFNFDIDGAAPAHRIYFADFLPRVRAVIDGRYGARHDARQAALRERHPAPLLRADRGLRRRRAVAQRPVDALRVQGRRLVLVGLRERHVGAGRHLGLRGPDRRGVVAGRLRVALPRQGRRVVGRGRARHRRRAARPVPPHRRPVVVAPGARDRRRRRARRHRPRRPAVRDRPAARRLRPARRCPRHGRAAPRSAPICPYKGEAGYLTVAGIADAAWTYEYPRPESTGIAGHVAFDAAKVTVTLG